VSRIILHIDMNSYFASVEQQANPFLRGKAIGITGKRQERSVIATASIEAKALGVKTAMSTWEAKKICPELILIAGDPEKYSEITERFNKIFKDFTHQVERFSVDESFLDLTLEAGDYFTATMIAQMIRMRLSEECGLWITASIGIGPNKLIAKLSSERMKPNGLTVTRPEDVIKLMDSVELQDVCGIGPATDYQLKNLGLTSFKHLREYPINLLIQKFKKRGYWLHEAAFGRDSSSVVPENKKPKSIGHSYTLPENTFDPDVIQHYLLGLADKVGWRLRRGGFSTCCISTYVRFSDFSDHSHEHCFREPVDDGFKLFKIAWKLIEKNIITSPKQVRLIGLSARQLTNDPKQSSLLLSEQKSQQLLPALDKIQNRYGPNSWTRASLLRTNLKKRTSGFAYDHAL